MRKRLGESGFTMVELSVTVAIIGIMAAISIPSLKNVMPRFRLANTAQILANEITTARMAAIAKSVDSGVVFTKAVEISPGEYSFPGRYELAKTVGGSPYAATTLGPSVVLESLEFGDDTDNPGTPSASPFTLQLNANGTTNVSFTQKALRIVLATETGTPRKKRVLVWTTGRIQVQKWAGGSTFVAD